MSVIVTNARNRIAYNVARSLGQRGIPVISADLVPSAMTYGSRYSKGKFIYPSPYTQQQAFIDCLIRMGNQLRAGILIPVFEETFLVAKHKENLAKHFNMVLPDYQQILVAHNKDQWEPIASSIDIPTPANYSIIELKKDMQLISEINFPVLIKPKQGGGGWAITQIDSATELKAALSAEDNHDLPWERFFIQELIPGETYCTAMLFRKGEYRAKVTYKQLRQFPVQAGQATLRVSVRNPMAEEYLQRFLEKMNWHGICQADFIIDERTGTPFLIDINPRFWGSLAQGLAAGVDFPYLVYKIARDGDVSPLASFREGVKSRWLGGDLRTFYPSLKLADKKWAFLKNFFFSNPRNYFYDDFSLNDPAPLFIWSYNAVKDEILKRFGANSGHNSLDGIWK